MDFAATSSKIYGKHIVHARDCPILVPECWKKGDPPLGLAKALELMQYVCYGCKKQLKPGAFKLCGGCSSSFYCNKECQKADWKEHKDVCRAFQHDPAFIRAMIDERYGGLCSKD